MGITSLSFIIFFLIVVFLYYLVPTKIKWIYLLLVSLVYIGLSGNAILILYPVFTSFATWICAKQIQYKKSKKVALYIGLIANVGVLVLLKYLNLIVYTHNGFMKLFNIGSAAWNAFRWMAPIGLSFYTMSLIAYLFDVYYELTDAENNYFKVLTFGVYFPILVSGPILRYKDFSKELFTSHKLEYKNITYGLQRMVYGFFKVLVISERLAVLIAPIYSDFSTYRGVYIFIAMFGFSLQLYTNFSGSMDIVIGASQVLGITLPENFRQPFFSETVQEFWQRWHITLGAWLKDYILYPLLRTTAFTNLSKKWKDKLGKKKAKRYVTYIAMAILWFVSGLWHGGAWKYIWGTGILQCIYIIGGEVLEGFNTKFVEKLHVNTKSCIYHILRKARTFLLLSIGFMFFNANSLTDGFKMLWAGITTWNPHVLINGDVLTLGLDIEELVVLCMSLVIMLIVSIIQTKGSVRDWLAKRKIVVRWCILYVAIFYVIIFGSYGPGYSAAEFIYQGF